MAIVKKNLVTKGLSGKLGDTIVFRNVEGDTIVSTVPTSSNNPSNAQANVRSRFQQAVIYAKAVIADPATKLPYDEVAKSRKRTHAYNIAVADFFNAPEILEVDSSGFNGQQGDSITAKVTDDFKVDSVTIEVYDPNDNLTHSGDATIQQNGLDWVFTASNSSNVDGGKIIIKAKDLPGNLTEQEIIIS